MKMRQYPKVEKEWFTEVQQVDEGNGRTVTTSRFVRRTMYTRKNGSRYVIVMGNRKPVDNNAVGMPYYVINARRVVGFSGADVIAEIRRRQAEAKDKEE
jgi:hypothetical protein